MSIDAAALMAEVRENQRKLKNCPRHRFAGGPIKLGAKHTCLWCGGSISNSDLLSYCRGFAAAGGDPNVVYPEWQP
jgi:hypothetical protein